MSNQRQQPLQQHMNTLANAYASQLGSKVVVGSTTLPIMPLKNKGNRPPKHYDDLKVGDRIVILPSSPLSDTSASPKWGGTYGQIIGRITRVAPDDISIAFGEVETNWGRPHFVLIDSGVVAAASEASVLRMLEKQGISTTKPGKVEFDSIILPDEKKKQIRDAISQVDNHDLIFNKWGFGSVFEKGTAISLLFYGSPGTGKTLMGQAIAEEFNYKLQIITTAEIESMEPGGAERSIKAFFEEADKNKKTVLLFDECDSLISDRSNVGMILAAQINALLMCLERYTGIAIFTTNRLGSLDPAFERRLSLKMEFEMPTPEMRKKIWLRMIPDKAPLDNVDWDSLAEIEVAGGNIKNAVLRAAREAAASTEKRITQAMIARALMREVEEGERFHDALSKNKTPRMTGYSMNAGKTLDKRAT